MPYNLSEDTKNIYFSKTEVLTDKHIIDIYIPRAVTQDIRITIPVYDFKNTLVLYNIYPGSFKQGNISNFYINLYKYFSGIDDIVEIAQHGSSAFCPLGANWCDSGGERYTKCKVFQNGRSWTGETEDTGGGGIGDRRSHRARTRRPDRDEVSR